MRPGSRDTFAGFGRCCTGVAQPSNQADERHPKHVPSCYVAFWLGLSETGPYGQWPEYQRWGADSRVKRRRRTESTADCLTAASEG
eukprot:922-Chlamydomonas_euryale.AAC.1